MDEEQQQNAQVIEEGLPPQVPGAGFPPIDLDKDKTDFLKWSLESEEALEQLKHDLKGEEPIFEGSEIIWKEIPERRVMNNIGINKIIITLKPFLGKEYTTANIKPEESHRITKELIHVLIDMIYANYWEWELNASTYRWLIKTLDDQVYLALTRVNNAGIRQMFTKNYKRVETYGQQPKGKGGFFGNLFKK